MTTKIRIGTRGSALALWQADYVAATLHAATGVTTERIIFKTRGDAILDRPSRRSVARGCSPRELEVALADGEIDIAVHSLKDMPTQFPEGLEIGAVPVRGDVRDCVVTPTDSPVVPVVPVGVSSSTDGGVAVGGSSSSAGCFFGNVSVEMRVRSPWRPPQMRGPRPYPPTPTGCVAGGTSSGSRPPTIGHHAGCRLPACAPARDRVGRSGRRRMRDAATRSSSGCSPAREAARHQGRPPPGARSTCPWGATTSRCTGPGASTTCSRRPAPSTTSPSTRCCSECSTRCSISTSSPRRSASRSDRANGRRSSTSTTWCTPSRGRMPKSS